MQFVQFAEWLLYASDSALDNETSKCDGDTCGYWKHVSMMVDNNDAQKKYAHLSFVGKAALTLSHGNAAPERGFSANNALVTKERGSLSERSIVAVSCERSRPHVWFLYKCSYNKGDATCCKAGSFRICCIS